MTRKYLASADLSSWVDTILRKVKSANTIVTDIPSLPAKFTRFTQSMMIEAMRYGRWLAHSYIQDIRALYGVRRDGDEELKKKLKIELSDWDEVLPEAALEWIKSYVPKLAGNLEESVRVRVRDTISAALMNGEPIRQTADALEPVLKSATRARLETIARTEITRADTMGRLIEYKSSDDVEGVEFSAILDDRTTEICHERHGLVMRIDDPRLARNSPPLHPNCRSMLLAVMSYDKDLDWETSPEFDDVPDGMQRDSDIETVNIALEQGEKAKLERQRQDALAWQEKVSKKKEKLNLSEEEGKIYRATGVRRGEPMSIEEALAGANPNYSKLRAEKYHINCQRCAPAYELRRRGYNVEAMPNNDNPNDIIRTGHECFFKENLEGWQVFDHMTITDGCDMIENSPAGARYMIYVNWEGKNYGHVFNAEKTPDGKVFYIDPQSNKTDVSRYFSRSDGYLHILRVDDKPIVSTIGVISKTVKASKGR